MAVKGVKHGVMHNRILAIGLEEGRKREVIWDEHGYLLGDADLQARFENAWCTTPWGHQPWEVPRDNDFEDMADAERYARQRTAEGILRGLFPELLDLERYLYFTPEELEALAAQLTARHPDQPPVTVAMLEQRGLRDRRTMHLQPVSEWERIVPWLDRPPPPEEKLPAVPPPRCLECLTPMEWVWYSSPAGAWAARVGREGFVPVCRPCRTLRAGIIYTLN